MEDPDVVRDHALPKPKFTVVQNVNRHDGGRVQMKFGVICILGDVGEETYGGIVKNYITRVGINDPSFKTPNSPPTLLPRSNMCRRASSTRAAASFV